MNQRLTEVARLGFSKCVIPSRVKGEIKAPKGLELIHVRNVREAMEAVLTV
jgi:DNA repair protein RadA/Sms